MIERTSRSNSDDADNSSGIPVWNGLDEAERILAQEERYETWSRERDGIKAVRYVEGLIMPRSSRFRRRKG